MRLSAVAFAERKSVLPKNIFLAAIYIIILLIVLIAIVSFASAWDLTHPEKITTPQISSNIAPDYRNISFYTESMEKINGWFFDSLGSKNAVLLVHGYGRNRLEFDEETFKLISQLKNEGLNVMTFDLRGSGNSSGSISTFGGNEAADVLSAVKCLKQQGMEKIVLMGFTTGASSCLSALPETPYRDSIIGVIADSPYSSVENYMDYLIRSKIWLPDFPFKYPIKFAAQKISKADNELDLIPKIPEINPTPVLFIDGAQEEMSYSYNTKLLYEIYSRKNPVQADYWNSGADEYGKSFLIKPDEYMDKVNEFINRCIKYSEK